MAPVRREMYGHLVHYLDSRYWQPDADDRSAHCVVLCKTDGSSQSGEFVSSTMRRVDGIWTPVHPDDAIPQGWEVFAWTPRGGDAVRYYRNKFGGFTYDHIQALHRLKNVGRLPGNATLPVPRELMN